MRRRATRLVPLAAYAAGLALLLLAGGCLEEHALPTQPVQPPPPTGTGGPVAPDRILVVNTLSETLSSLDPSTGTMTEQAATAGAWVNRITADESGRLLFLTNSGENGITVLDAVSLRPVSSIDVGAGRNPWIATPLPGERLLVTNWLTGTIRVAMFTGALVGPALDTTPGPEGIAVRGGTAWIACTHYLGASGFGPGRVDEVDLASWQVVASIPVGTNPQDLAFDGAGRLHVVCTGPPSAGNGSVHVIDPVARSVVDVVAIGGEPGRIAADESRDVMWVVGFSGGLRGYDAATLVPLDAPPDPEVRGPGLSAVAYDAVRDALFVTHFEGDLLLELDAADASLRDVWLVGDGPVDVLVHRPGSDGAP
jgi:DNA-binding beta-propeller fold protein YncE